MPRYDYACDCGDEREVVHSINQCDGYVVVCFNCGRLMERRINKSLIKGDGIYPLNLWNIRAGERDGKPSGKNGGVIVENREQHEEIMRRHNCHTPYLNEEAAQDALSGVVK